MHNERRIGFLRTNQRTPPQTFQQTNLTPSHKEISAMPMTSDIRLDLPKPHPDNVRKTNRADGIEALANSIHAYGLLNNLAVVENGGDYLVIAGGRRLAALQQLVKEKKLDAHFDVPCQV